MLEGDCEFARNMKVVELFQQNSKVWNEEKVNSLFTEGDARAILNTVIPQHVTGDRITWVNTKDGHYTVKSGYHVW